MSAESVDALITDPPAGISFMGKDWDHGDGFIQRMARIYGECFRVLKPGAHGLVWALPRTSHWTATALEQAGFEIRDVITHIFGSGFPKNLDVSKAIDKMAGAERKIIGVKSDRRYLSPRTNSPMHMDREKGTDAGHGADHKAAQITAPSTAEAKLWQGWGTALKPANEHWLLVRKPLSEPTVAKNVLKHGTGALNIDASRISTNGKIVWKIGERPVEDCVYVYTDKPGAGSDSMMKNKGNRQGTSQGRFPANLIVDETAIEELDQHGASRFFYCAKASKRDRGEDNKHPTVKSTNLMGYLIRLITPPNGVVLDPFAGSGSTGVAAKRFGFGFIGIEQAAEYCKIAQARLDAAILEPAKGAGNGEP